MLFKRWNFSAFYGIFNFTLHAWMSSTDIIRSVLLITVGVVVCWYLEQDEFKPNGNDIFAVVLSSHIDRDVKFSSGLYLESSHEDSLHRSVILEALTSTGFFKRRILKRERDS